MMQCMELENLALDYLEGTLAPPERLTLEAHLGACVACAVRLREFSEGFGATAAVLNGWPSVPPSRDFDRLVLDRIAAESATSAGLWRGLLAPFFASLMRPAFAGGLSAVLLAAFAVVRFLPATGENLAGTSDPYFTGIDRTDEVALVQDLTDLDDLEMLRNFEVLQEMKGSTP